MRSLMFVNRPAILALPACTRHALALSAVLALAPLPALASTQVHGTPDAVTIEVKNASIEEILGDLGKTFDLKYQSTGKLEKQLTGTYRGSLQRVVTRILEGYNFVVKSRSGKLEVSVLAPHPASDSAMPIQAAKSDVAAAPAPIASSPSQISPAAKTTVAAKTAAAEPAPAATSDSALPAPVITLAESNAVPPMVPTVEPGKGEVPELLPSTTEMPTPGPSLVAPPEPMPTTGTLLTPMPMTIDPPESQSGPVPQMNATGSAAMPQMNGTGSKRDVPTPTK